MKFLNFRKKITEEKLVPCDCGNMCPESEVKKKQSCCDIDSNTISNHDLSKGAPIKILGSGCKKCNDLEKNVVLALNELNKDIEIDHITDFSEIASYGVMSTPALVLNGKVLSYGKVLSVKEAKEILEKEMV